MTTVNHTHNRTKAAFSCLRKCHFSGTQQDKSCILTPKEMSLFKYMKVIDRNINFLNFMKFKEITSYHIPCTWHIGEIQLLSCAPSTKLTKITLAITTLLGICSLQWTCSYDPRTRIRYLLLLLPTWRCTFGRLVVVKYEDNMCISLSQLSLATQLYIVPELPDEIVAAVTSALASILQPPMVAGKNGRWKQVMTM